MSKSDGIEVTINGARESVAGEISIAEYLRGREIDPRSVVVELNLEIIDRSEYVSRRLCEGDSLEILRFVGGG
jgi:sulfur carrier protein